LFLLENIVFYRVVMVEIKLIVGNVLPYLTAAVFL